MTAGKRGVGILAETLRESGSIGGPARVVVPTLRALDVPWQHDSRRGRYLVPLGRFDDVLAALEMAGHRVEVVGAGLW